MLDRLSPEHWHVGLELPEFRRGPVTRRDLALFAGGSHDHVAFHIDTDAAKAAGFDDVIVHGMLSMAYLGQALTYWAGQERLLRWQTRFVAITPLNAIVCCHGVVAEIGSVEGAMRAARLTVAAWIASDVQTLAGEAWIALNDHVATARIQ